MRAVDRIDIAIVSAGLAGPCVRKAVIGTLAAGIRAGYRDPRDIAQVLPARRAIPKGITAA